RLNKLGEAIKNGKVKIDLVRVERNYFWTYSTDKGWHYDRSTTEYNVKDLVRTFDEQPVLVRLNVEWGEYRLELTDLESKGKTIYRFQAGERWYNAWENNDNSIRPDRISLALDKPSYKSGDSVKLKVAAPFAGNALITIESYKVLYQEQFEVSKGTSEITLTLPENLDRHDLYITAFLLPPSGEHAESVSKRSFGIIHLPLNRDDKKIDLAIEIPERWLPNQKVFVKIIAKDAAGNPVSGNARVTLSAVDSGALSVTGYKVNNPYSLFYGQRAYQGSITDVYDYVMTTVLGSKANILWGGDAELTRGGEKAKNEVQIVSLFSGLVKLKDGVAEIPLQLPTFDGELTLTAIAFDQDQFGKAKETIKVASQVVLQVSMPKFLASSDMSEIALDITNITEASIKTELTLNTGGKLIEQNNKALLTLEPNKKQTLYFLLRATEDIGVGTIEAKLTIGKRILKREWVLAVRDTQAAEFHSQKEL
ncbi:MAG: hypothetical protein KAI17_27120, partial [Thiotrichaceae bacterium]|nr:hypothetical protein [Thiotrichaceae bacterium]